MNSDIGYARRRRVPSRPRLSPAGPGPAEFSQLLLRVHRIAAEPQRAGELLGAICETLDARHASLAVCDGSGQHMHYLYFHPYPSVEAASYVRDWGAQDPLRRAILAAEPGRFLVKDELVDPALQRDHPYFSEWCAGFGFEHIGVARIPLDADQHCLFSCVRGPGELPFSRVEIAFLDSLLPHLARALALGRHFERLQILADIAHLRLQHTGQGVLVVDGEGRVVYMNATGSAMLQDARLFRPTSERLQLMDDAREKRFEELLAQCIALSGSRTILGGGAIALPRAEGAPLVVSVLPYRHRDSLGTYVSSLGRAIVTLFDPAAPRADTRRSLRELYGLTRAEADVCWRLGNGDSVERIARDAGISRETVRSHLKRVFTKTGTRRQPDLLRLVLAGPVAWSPGH